MKGTTVIADFFQEMWLRCNLRWAKWDLELAEEAERTNIAATWRAYVASLEDRLKELGIDINAEPEPLQKTFELWLLLGIVAATLVFAFGLFAYHDALAILIHR